MAQELVRESAVPLYAQLEEIFRAKIRSGEWAEGERIPSENELNRGYGVSRMTARGVLNKLVDEGLLFRVAGKGTFVAQPKIKYKSPAYAGVREQLELLGYRTETALVHQGVQAPSSVVRERLRLEDEERVVAIERVRSASGTPISLHYSYVPLSLAPTLEERDPVTEQLCVILDQHYGLRMRHVEEKLESVPAGRAVAQRLGIAEGDPVLLLEDVICDAQRRPFEYSRILFRGDRVQLNFSYDL